MMNIFTQEGLDRGRDCPEVQERSTRVLHDVGRKSRADVVLSKRYTTGIISELSLNILPYYLFPIPNKFKKIPNIEIVKML